MQQRENIALLATGLCATVWIVLYTWQHQFTFADDAFIFFRYADNIALGTGPVFNQGERVEGFTSPLWLGLLTVARILNVNVLHSATIMGMLLAIGAVLLLLFFPISKTGPILRCLGVVALCTQDWFLFWITSGMETMLFTFLLLAAVSTFLKEKHRHTPHIPSGILSSLAFLSRPEGLLLFPMLLLSTGRKKGFILSWLPLPIGYFIFRLLYYDALIPNTATAKIVFDANHLAMGSQYILDFFNHVPLALLAFFPAVFFLWPQCQIFDELRPVIQRVLISVILFLGYFIAIGGDFFEYHRFFVPLFPWIILLSTWGLQLLFLQISSSRRNAIVKWVAICLFTVATALSIRDLPLHSQHGVSWIIASGKLGVALQDQYPADTLIAAPHIGALGYYSRLPLLDMLGLTNTHIARKSIDQVMLQHYRKHDVGHERYDIDYALRQKPQIFIPIHGFSSRLATDISEVPTNFAMEYALIDRLKKQQKYQVGNIPVDPYFSWIVLIRAPERNSI
ncbi:MAG: hypothetical protein JXX14_24855 [Deltaproteobacteria bacterium]|nr:hypothetical protein [Deltaproteobacteria bacterium]